MKYLTAIIVILFQFSIISCSKTDNNNTDKIMLLNPGIIGTMPGACSQIWQNPHPPKNEIYPQEIRMDINNNAISGLMAAYDRSIGIDEIKLAIDNKFKKWASANNNASSVKLWRVLDGKFAIQLSTGDDGMKHVIYMAFR